MTPTDPATDGLRRYATELMAGAHPADAAALLARAREAPARMTSPRRRFATVLAAATLFVAANAGLALAADGAAPGDVLYPIDRTYERLASMVGLDGESANERLDEATVVVARGEARSAVAQTRRALDSLDSAPWLPHAIRAVKEAETALDEADAVSESGPAELRAAVEDLIATAREVATAAKSGKDPTAAVDKVKEKAADVAAAARSNRPDHAGKDGAPGQNKEPGQPAEGKGKAEQGAGES